MTQHTWEFHGVERISEQLARWHAVEETRAEAIEHAAWAGVTCSWTTEHAGFRLTVVPALRAPNQGQWQWSVRDAGSLELRSEGYCASHDVARQSAYGAADALRRNER